jgi:hypothetical protein
MPVARNATASVDMLIRFVLNGEKGYLFVSVFFGMSRMRLERNGILPKVVNDDMIEVPEDMKKIIRRIGYANCARLICKSESFVRSVASKGKKRMRRTELEIIDAARSSY